MVHNVFLSCMPFDYANEDIRKLLSPFGKIESIRLFEDKEKATFDAYAHIRIDSSNIQELLQRIDGKPMKSRVLRANLVVDRQDNLIFEEAENEKS